MFQEGFPSRNTSIALLEKYLNFSLKISEKCVGGYILCKMARIYVKSFGKIFAQNPTDDHFIEFIEFLARALRVECI